MKIIYISIIILTVLITLSNSSMGLSGISINQAEEYDNQSIQKLEPKSASSTNVLKPIEIINSIKYINPKSYKVVYTASAINNGFEMEDLRLYQPYPIDWDGQYDVSILQIIPSATRISEEPTFGNKIIFWHPQIMPGKGNSSDFVIVFTLKAYETISNINFSSIESYNKKSEDYILYTRSERFIECSDPQIRKLAQEIADSETNPYLLAQKFYNYVIDNIQYKAIGKGLKGAKATINSLSGECGDFSASFIALCRSSGIPARPIVGWWAASGNDQYHVWAEFYLEGIGWLPVDPTVGQQPNQRNQYFGKMDNRRIILNKGFNIQFIPPMPDGSTAQFLQAPLWWFWGKGDDNLVKFERIWIVQKIMDKNLSSLKPQVAPIVKKSQIAPIVKKSQIAPIVKKSQIAPIVKKSQIAPIVKKSQVAPIVKKSQVAPPSQKINPDRNSIVQFYWGFDKGFDGWERTGTVPQWSGYTLENSIKWNDRWSNSQGVIVIDAGFLPRKGIDASGGIRKTISLPANSNEIIFNIIKKDHDGGFRAILDFKGKKFILGDTILKKGDRKALTYSLSQWAGKLVTIEARAFAAGIDAVGCDSDAGKCCYEHIGIDSIQLKTQSMISGNEV
jgi:hypothetical protein